MDELKNLVIQTLETNGILGQIRAKLRSSVFKVIDNNDPSGKERAMHWENPLAQKVLETTESELAADLIKEYLEFYRLDYSLSILIPEANLKQDPMNRDELVKKAEIENANQDEPLLVQILKERKAGGAAKSGRTGGQKEEESKRPIQTSPKEEEKASKYSSNTGMTKKSEPQKEKEHKSNLGRQDDKPKTSPKEKSGKKDDFNDYEDDFEDDDIEEMLPVEDQEDQDNENKFTESGQFTGSQSMGMDPSVNTLAMDEYDHVEEVIHMD